MDKLVIIAKIKKWQAELQEMLDTLNREGKKGPIVDILKKRDEELEALIGTIQDKSFIPREDVSFEPAPVVAEIGAKVKKVKEGVKRLAALKKEKEKILEELKAEA